MNYPTTESASTVSTVKYNTAGSVVSKTTPWYGTNTRTVSISYTDNFNSTVSPATYAYPTTVTDPNSQSSTVKYRFDIGANVEATSPAPAGQTYGKTSKRLYDSIGRLERDSVYVNTTEKFYTRFEFTTNGIQTKSYTTVNDVDGDANIAEDEVYSESWLDGAGRVLRSRTEHPGSTGGWSAVQTTYDMLGRTASQSVPTEVSVSGTTWTAAGDDATRGFIYGYTYYDWKGRTSRTVPSDSNGSDDKDTLISYEGCGCAGGQITTVQGPSVPRDDTSGNARRVQKVYEDILGRSFKTEVLRWDGTTVDTTTVTTFNGRDQITRTRQFEGAATSTTYQDVTMTYDGFGRMKTRHYPIEDVATETTWNYNLDDSIYQIIDPRGAITDFTYDNRGLTTQIAYTPVTGVPDTPTVTFTYDNLGNRITADVAGITDTAYTYDSLSRLTKERVKYDDLGSTNFDIDYSYDQTGKLKSITDPFGYAVNYAQDKTGRLSSVSGAALAQHSNGPFADNIQYRAFGSTKQIDYKLPSSETAVVKMGYNDGLLVDHFEATEPGSTTQFASKADFSYLADGRTSAKDDTENNAFDRTFKYDFAGRLSYNQFGVDAGTSKRVYEQSVGYDGFSNLTSRATTYWDEQNDMDAEFENGRITSDNTVVYDAAGNIVSKGTGATLRTDTFDASGRRTSSKDRWASSGGQGATVNERQTDHIVDGDGRPVIEKLGARQYSPTPGTLTMAVYKYQVWSTVLGKAVAVMDNAGNQVENRVYMGGTLLATSWGRATTGTSADDAITFHAKDPVTETEVNYAYNANGSTFASNETEPFGQNISNIDPYIQEWNNYAQVSNGAQDPEWQCTLFEKMNGGFGDMPVHCQKSAMQENYFGYDNKFWKGKADDITTIAHEAAHAHSNNAANGSGNSVSNEVIANTETATKKSEKGGPNASDDPDTPNCGTQDCIVTVRDLDVPGFVEVSESGFESSGFGPNKNRVEALDGAEAILSGSSDCAKWFGSNGLAALKAFRNQFLKAPQTMITQSDYLGIRQYSNEDNPLRYFDANDKEVVPTLAAYRLFAKVEIQTTGPFVNPTSRSKIGGTYRPASLESRIAQVLHEIAHLTIDPISRNFLIVDDGRAESTSVSNTKLILETKKCGEAISSYIDQQKNKGKTN